MSKPDLPVVYGAAYSVYVRAVRLTLEEKGVAYRLVPVDIFAKEGAPDGYLEWHPFGKIPAFADGDFRLYETGAITRYIDERFPGPPLQPSNPRERARMNQAMSILDSYVYRTLVWDIFVERIVAPREKRTPNEARIAAALPRASVCLSALEDIMGEGPFLEGTELTLADLHAAPMFACFAMTAESQRLFARHARLNAWWERVRVRPGMASTAPE